MARPGAQAKLSLAVCWSHECHSILCTFPGHPWSSVGRPVLPVDAGSLTAEPGPGCADPGVADDRRGLPLAPSLFGWPG